MNRRSFLQLLGASVALSAGGIALLEPEPVKAVTYFLPPRGGWAASLLGAWELQLAKEALAAVDRRLGGLVDRSVNPPIVVTQTDIHGTVFDVFSQLSPDLKRLIERRKQLLAKIDYLAKGGKPAGVRTTDGGAWGPVVVHGGRRPMGYAEFFRQREATRDQVLAELVSKYGSHIVKDAFT